MVTKQKPAARKKMPAPRNSVGRKGLLSFKEESQICKINGHEIRFTNLSKVFWPVEGYTKRDMINYYYEIGPYMLPYLKDRPQSLNRYPNGIAGKSFYHKDLTVAPGWVKKFPYTTSEGENKKPGLKAPVVRCSIRAFCVLNKIRSAKDPRFT